MITEDDIARDLRAGTISLDQALAAFDGDDVFVYRPIEVDYSTATWDEVDEAAVGSATLFQALHKAGASEEQKDAVGRNIERLRAAGNVF